MDSNHEIVHRFPATWCWSHWWWWQWWWWWSGWSCQWVRIRFAKSSPDCTTATRQTLPEENSIHPSTMPSITKKWKWYCICISYEFGLAWCSANKTTPFHRIDPPKKVFFNQYGQREATKLPFLDKCCWSTLSICKTFDIFQVCLQD